jgi:hypothetical protein
LDRGNCRAAEQTFALDLLDATTGRGFAVKWRSWTSDTDSIDHGYMERESETHL